MSIHDEADYPWLIPEKLLIAICLERNKYVLGVCLGLSCWEGHFVGKRRTTCVVACPPHLQGFGRRCFRIFRTSKMDKSGRVPSGIRRRKNASRTRHLMRWSLSRKNSPVHPTPLCSPPHNAGSISPFATWPLVTFCCESALPCVTEDCRTLQSQKTKPFVWSCTRCSATPCNMAFCLRLLLT
jgi:hypothetical protein